MERVFNNDNIIYPPRLGVKPYFKSKSSMVKARIHYFLGNDPSEKFFTFNTVFIFPYNENQTRVALNFAWYITQNLNTMGILKVPSGMFTIRVVGKDLHLTLIPDPDDDEYCIRRTFPLIDCAYALSIDIAPCFDNSTFALQILPSSGGLGYLIIGCDLNYSPNGYMVRKLNKIIERAHDNFVIERHNHSRYTIDYALLKRHVKSLNSILRKMIDMSINIARSSAAKLQLERYAKQFNVVMAREKSIESIAKSPTTAELIDIFRKIKLAMNYMGRLNPFVSNPNIPEIMHHLLSPLSLITTISGLHIVQNVRKPYLSSKAIWLIENCFTSEELEFWRTLGMFWNKPRCEIDTYYDASTEFEPLYDDVNDVYMPDSSYNTEAVNYTFKNFDEPMLGIVLSSYRACYQDELSAMEGSYVYITYKKPGFYFVCDAKYNDGFIPKYKIMLLTPASAEDEITEFFHYIMDKMTRRWYKVMDYEMTRATPFPTQPIVDLEDENWDVPHHHECPPMMITQDNAERRESPDLMLPPGRIRHHGYAHPLYGRNLVQKNNQSSDKDRVVNNGNPIKESKRQQKYIIAEEVYYHGSSFEESDDSSSDESLDAEAARHDWLERRERSRLERTYSFRSIFCCLVETDFETDSQSMNLEFIQKNKASTPIANIMLPPMEYIPEKSPSKHAIHPPIVPKYVPPLPKPHTPPPPKQKINTPKISPVVKYPEPQEVKCKCQSSVSTTKGQEQFLDCSDKRVASCKFKNICLSWEKSDTTQLDCIKVEGLKLFRVRIKLIACEEEADDSVSSAKATLFLRSENDISLLPNTQVFLSPSETVNTETATNLTTTNLTASNVTATNATASNVTATNATASNVTPSNLTASNVTASNETDKNEESAQKTFNEHIIDYDSIVSNFEFDDCDIARNYGTSSTAGSSDTTLDEEQVEQLIEQVHISALVESDKSESKTLMEASKKILESEEKDEEYSYSENYESVDQEIQGIFLDDPQGFNDMDPQLKLLRDVYLSSLDLGLNKSRSRTHNDTTTSKFTVSDEIYKILKKYVPNIHVFQSESQSNDSSSHHGLTATDALIDFYNNHICKDCGGMYKEAMIRKKEHGRTALTGNPDSISSEEYARQAERDAYDKIRDDEYFACHAREVAEGEDDCYLNMRYINGQLNPLIAGTLNLKRPCKSSSKSQNIPHDGRQPSTRYPKSIYYTDPETCAEVGEAPSVNTLDQPSTGDPTLCSQPSTGSMSFATPLGSAQSSFKVLPIDTSSSKNTASITHQYNQKQIPTIPSSDSLSNKSSNTLQKSPVPCSSSPTGTYENSGIEHPYGHVRVYPAPNDSSYVIHALPPVVTTSCSDSRSPPSDSCSVQLPARPPSLVSKSNPSSAQPSDSSKNAASLSPKPDTASSLPSDSSTTVALGSPKPDALSSEPSESYTLASVSPKPDSPSLQPSDSSTVASQSPRPDATPSQPSDSSTVVPRSPQPDATSQPPDCSNVASRSPRPDATPSQPSDSSTVVSRSPRPDATPSQPSDSSTVVSRSPRPDATPSQPSDSSTVVSRSLRPDATPSQPSDSPTVTSRSPIPDATPSQPSPSSSNAASTSPKPDGTSTQSSAASSMRSRSIKPDDTSVQPSTSSPGLSFIATRSDANNLQPLTITPMVASGSPKPGVISTQPCAANPPAVSTSPKPDSTSTQPCTTSPTAVSTSPKLDATSVQPSTSCASIASSSPKPDPISTPLSTSSPNVISSSLQPDISVIPPLNTFPNVASISPKHEPPTTTTPSTGIGSEAPSIVSSSVNGARDTSPRRTPSPSTQPAALGADSLDRLSPSISLPTTNIEGAPATVGVSELANKPLSNITDSNITSTPASSAASTNTVGANSEIRTVSSETMISAAPELPPVAPNVVVASETTLESAPATVLNPTNTPSIDSTRINLESQPISSDATVRTANETILASLSPTRLSESGNLASNGININPGDANNGDGILEPPVTNIPAPTVNTNPMLGLSSDIASTLLTATTSMDTTVSTDAHSMPSNISTANTTSLINENASTINVLTPATSTLPNSG